MSVIATKEEFNRLSQAGKLGNFLRTWKDIDAVEQAGYRGWLTIQSKDKQSPHFVPWAAYKLTVDHPGYMNADEAVQWLLGRGARREQMYFREVPGPNARRTIQFEAMLGPKWQGAGSGVELFYELDSTLPLRDIRERCKTADGAIAQRILRETMSPTSYETLTDLWDRYPTAIIEATEFSERVGVFNQHLVVWEARDF